MAMSSDLPRDLLEEILCRVPTTSLKRLRSTCKQWNSLFNNEKFTRKHFHKAPKQFLILMVTEYKVFSMSVNLHGHLPVEVTSELSLIDPRSSLDQFEITQVFHCDGLLLCSNEDHNRIVVWNPCTSQTRWIYSKSYMNYYALGSYRDKKSDGNSYKILSYMSLGFDDEEIAIYEMNSNSWRTLDVTCDCHPIYNENIKSLNGKTYWFASDEKEEQLGIFLLSFDYTTERFGRLSLPYQFSSYQYICLSVVREEKLSVLLKRKDTTHTSTEIWVTNKIGETKVVSWSKILTVDFSPELVIWYTTTFLVDDEEKKVVVCCDKYMFNELQGENLVHVVGEENKIRQVDFGLVESWPSLVNYVPSLTQIQRCS